MLLLAGCGGGSSSQPAGPGLSGNTQVTLVTSSTANDRFAGYEATINGLSLVNSEGISVPLINAYWNAEFIHVNGQIEPLLTVSVPQGVYTSATINIFAASFTFLDILANGVANTDLVGLQEVAVPSTISLPQPITITGSSMALNLDLLLPQSGSYPSRTSASSYAVTPTFALSPVSVSQAPDSARDGKLIGLNGILTQASSLGFTANLPDSSLPSRIGNQPVSFLVDSSTVYQGIGSASALTPGLLVNFDAAIQPDGSLLATRVASLDIGAQNVMIGQLMLTDTDVQNGTPRLLLNAAENLGTYLSTSPPDAGAYYIAGATSFQTAPGVTGVQSLPFPASFSEVGTFPGQMLAVTFGAPVTMGTTSPPARTVTLMPQTVDGTVTAITSQGGFTVYTLALDESDNIVGLGGPSSVTAYVGPDALLLNSAAPAVGGLLRCTGLIFNDKGTLRMDCTQVDEGVPF